MDNIRISTLGWYYFFVLFFFIFLRNIVTFTVINRKNKKESNKMENLLLEIYIQQQIESALCFDFWLSNNPEDNEEIIPKQPCITDSVDYEDGYNESDLDYMYDPEY